MKKIISVLLFSLFFVFACNKSESILPDNSKIPTSNTINTGGSITLDFNNPKQVINSIGAGTYFFSNHILNLTNYEEAAKWIWGDLGVNSLKIVFRASAEDINDNDNPDITDFSKFTFAANTNNVTQIATAKKALAINPNIKIWAIVLSPPKFLKTNNSAINGGTLNAAYPKAYEEFGEFVYAHLKNLKDNGVTVSSLSLMNEPDIASSTIGYDSAEFTPQQAASVYSSTVNWLKTKLSSSGITIPTIGGPDCINVNFINRFVTPLNNTNNIDFFTTHIYGETTIESFTNAVKLTGPKNLYMTEWHAGHNLGERPDEMVAALGLVSKFNHTFKGGANGWSYFEYGSPGVNFSGLVFTPFNGMGIRKKNYYIFQQYLKDILSKNFVNTTLSGVEIFKEENISAFQSATGATVNVVNFDVTQTQKKVRINFGKTIKIITIHRTNGVEDNVEILTKSNVDSPFFEVDFEPRSLTTVRVTY
jgi:O-glycosyl hydrolase